MYSIRRFSPFRNFISGQMDFLKLFRLRISNATAAICRFLICEKFTSPAVTVGNFFYQKETEGLSSFQHSWNCFSALEQCETVSALLNCAKLFQRSWTVWNCFSALEPCETVSALLNRVKLFQPSWTVRNCFCVLELCETVSALLNRVKLFQRFWTVWNGFFRAIYVHILYI